MDPIKLLEKYFLYEVIVVTWLIFLWRMYLRLRQRALVKRLVDMPLSLEGLMTEEIYQSSRRYALHNTDFALIKDTTLEIIYTIFLATFCFRRLWVVSVDACKYVGLNHENEITVSVVYTFLANVLLSILDLPFSVYDTFVLEEKHGFNKQKPLFFVKDQLLKFVVFQVIELPLLTAAIWVVKYTGDYFSVYLWLLSISASLFVLVVYPEVIAPLFDKYSPLPEGELKNKIEELAASVNFPLYKLFVVEGSKRSSHSNAYLYGFFKSKRIVLFDTLVKEFCKSEDAKNEKGNVREGCETDEVLAVLAHEIGHWKHNHALKIFALMQVMFLVKIFLLAKYLNNGPMYEAFGFTDERPVLIGLLIIKDSIMAPISTIIMYLSVALGRRFEFQADKYARTLGHKDALRRALIKLGKDNLGYPLYDKLYCSWNNSHPPLLERLEAIEKED